jgi:hypothetical protein
LTQLPAFFLCQPGVDVFFIQVGISFFSVNDLEEEIPVHANVYTFVQCCGSGMFIPDADFYPSRISDLPTTTKEEGENKIYCLFTQKFILGSQKYGVGIGYPRSGIRKKPILNPGSRDQKAPDPVRHNAFTYRYRLN